MHVTKRLELRGLLNVDQTFHESGYRGKPSKRRAFCFSTQCTKNDEDYQGVFITKDQSKTLCPNCGHALFWK